MYKEIKLMYGDSIMPREIPNHILLSFEDKLFFLERAFRRDLISDVEFGELMSEVFKVEGVGKNDR